MARTRTSSALELLVPLDRDAPEPLHRQLEQGLREAIRTAASARRRRCPRPARSPTSSGVSRGIVVEAYEQLVAEGYLVEPSRRRHPRRRARAAVAGARATRRQPSPYDVRLPARPP